MFFFLMKMDNDMVDQYGSLCQICFTRKPFYICPDCNVKTCKTCLKRYILDYSNLEPHCMQCRAKLSFKTIYNIFGAKGFDKYLDKSASIKFDLELQQVPECLECCTVLKFIRNIQDKIPLRVLTILSKIMSKMLVYSDENMLQTHSDRFCVTLSEIVLSILKYVTDNDDILAETSPFKNDMNTLFKIINSTGDYFLTKEQYETLQTSINDHIENKYGMNLDEIQQIPKKFVLMTEKDIIKFFMDKLNDKKLGKSSKNGYLFRCSYDNCNGFVNDKYKCELCRHRYCNKCFAILNDDKFNESESHSENHVCKQEDLLTAEEIMKSTKPCPKCASRIFKISGCSQMFCTNCHIGFDYNTGKIITKDFHNPHRMEWLLSNGKNVDDTQNNCETVSYLHNKYLMYRLYQMNHVKGILRRINRREVTNKTDLFYHRCKFVLNRISKDSFILFLKRLKLEKYKCGLLKQIYQEFVDTTNIILVGAKYKDKDALNLLSTYKISENLYSFVASNGLVNIVRSLVENNIPRSDFISAIDKILAYKRENGETIFKPNSCNIQALIHLTYDNRELVARFDTFDNEINLLNDLIEHTNLMLVNYKKMFKVNRISQLTSFGSEHYVEPL